MNRPASLAAYLHLKALVHQMRTQNPDPTRRVVPVPGLVLGVDRHPLTQHQNPKTA